MFARVNGVEEIVRVELPEAPESNVILVTLNVADGPLRTDGKTETMRARLPTKPFRLVTVIFDEDDAPAVKFSRAGAIVREKSGWPVT